MRWRRLGWAGLEVQADGASLVVDHLLDPGLFAHFLTDERDELVTPEPGSAAAALVTHLHRDHTDVAAIEAAVAPDGIVLRPWRKRVESALEKAATGESEEAFAASSLGAQSAVAGDRFEVGPFTLTALFASDGLGSPQVSWLVEAGNQRVLHAGDTLWHGAWWDTPALHGAVDVAFLPANGVELAYPGWEPPAAVPGVLTPEQCVDAAAALQAKTLVPIHYNRTFEHPKYYRPVRDARPRIDDAAAVRGIVVHFAAPGEWHELS